MLEAVLEKKLEPSQSYQDLVAMAGQYQSAPELSLCTCIHCNIKFEGKFAKKKLNNHLAHCKRRRLLRYYPHSNFVFAVVFNPTKGNRNVITNFLQNEDCKENLPVFIGGLMMMKEQKKIHDFQPLELKSSPDFRKLDNRLQSYNRVFRVLSIEDQVRFGSFCENVHAHRFDEVI